MDTAKIHFIGLLFLTSYNPFTQLMSNQAQRVDNNRTGYVLAIMPRVPYTPMQLRKTSASPASAKGAKRLAGATVPTMSVEPHTAALVFESSALIPATVVGWQVQPLNSLPYQYILLNGEKIVIVADAATETPNRMTTGKLQSSGGQLAADYQSPWPGAAAVFHVRNGRMNPCKSITTDDTGTAITRYDTKLELDNHGTITIKSTDGLKSAEFHGNATIAAVNAPSTWIDGHHPTTSPVPHYKVYCQMIGIGTDDTSCPTTLLGTPSLPAVGGDCTDAMEIIVHPNGGHGTTDTERNKTLRVIGSGNIAQSSDMFCSTTSWP